MFSPYICCKVFNIPALSEIKLYFSQKAEIPYFNIWSETVILRLFF